MAAEFWHFKGSPTYSHTPEHWEAWTGEDGKIDSFAGSISDEQIVDKFVRLEKTDDAKTFAGAIEFTLSVVPFGGAALSIEDKGWTLEAGILIVIDAATLIIPAAKLIPNPKIAKAVIRTAQAAGYAAAGAQAGFSIKDAFSSGVNWENSAQLVDALLMLADIKYSSKDALTAVNKSKQLADIVDAPKLKHVEQQELTNRAAAAERSVLPLLQETCFVAGTPVLTAEGSRPIESLKVGDAVLSRAENDVEAPLRQRRVEAVFELSAKIVELHVGGQVLETTAEHPMFVEGVGWRPAFELQECDLLVGHDLQRTAVEKVVLTDRTETVYNLRVADDHTYFVGRDDWGFSIWVHNTYVVVNKADGTYRVVEVLPGNLGVRLVDDNLTESQALLNAVSYNDAKAMKKLAGLLESSTSGVSKLLGDNIAQDLYGASADAMRKLGFDAHHIVPWDSPVAKEVREFMLANGFTMQEIQVGSFNGVWLPGSTRKNGLNIKSEWLRETWHKGAQPHASKHSKDTMNEILTRLEKHAGDKEMIKDEIRQIGKEMQRGEFRNR